MTARGGQGGVCRAHTMQSGGGGVHPIGRRQLTATQVNAQRKL